MVKSRCFFMLSLIRIVSSLSNFQLRLFMLKKKMLHFYDSFIKCISKVRI